MSTIIIAGRGPSITKTVLPEFPILAVSSGVFALGGRKPEHFCSLDRPRYFDTCRSDIPHAWPQDPICKWWSMCHDPDVRKHIPTHMASVGGKNRIPEGTQDTLDLDLLMLIRERGVTNMGDSPGWLDYPNVWVHAYEQSVGPCFDGNARMGLGDAGHANSLYFAVQVAAWMGCKRMFFAGIDLNEERFERVSDTLQRWYPLARAHGIEWLNLSGEMSRLAEWMPCGERVAT